MTIDDNKEAMAMMRKALGSIENRFREAYNKGYHDGLKEGIDQTTQKLVNKILEEVEADRKTENSSEKPNNSTISKMEQVDEPKTQTETQNSNLTFEKQTDCKTCKYGQDKHRYAHICNECGVGINNYTPQTERSE